MTPEHFAELTAKRDATERAEDAHLKAYDYFRDPDAFHDRDTYEELANAAFDAAVNVNLAEGALVALFSIVRCVILTDGSRWYVVTRGDL
jgi:hypothetical protein